MVVQIGWSRGVIFLVLMIMIGSSMADTKCYLPAPNLYHPSCCIEMTVDSNTITSTFTVTPLTSEVWILDANISWARPQGMYFNAYAIDLDYTETPSFANTCHDEYGNYIIRETEWIYLADVQFGSNPYFIVYTANRTAELINETPNDQKQIEFADCYESTKNIAFCQTQGVKVAGRPIELRVDSIIGEEQIDGSPLTATVTVSWNPPVQINSEVILTSFSASLHINDRQDGPATTVPVVESQRNYTNPLSLSFSHAFEGVEVNETNDVLVKVRAKVDNMGCSRPTSSCTGNIATLQINVGPEDVFTPMVHTTFVPMAGNDLTSSILLYSLIGTAFLFLCFMLVLCVYCRCRNRHGQTAGDALIKYKRSHKESNYIENPVSKKTPEERFAQTEIDRTLLSEINKINEIGKGSFGVVFKGFAFGSVNGKLGYYPVAVKGLKDNATEDMKSSFLEEISLMIDIGSHPNILSVLGCCTVDEPYYLVTEFMKYGDLLHFLWNTRENKMTEEDSIYNLTDLNQLQIARQVARGMEYISQTRYYHGDLAARNVLVGENLIVKVSDFGLADDIYERGYKQNEKKVRPVKWASLETNTTGRYSIHSDVWSFGIVLYEIFTRGEVPYQEVNNNKELIDKLKKGYRMEQPDECPVDVYAIMRKCWQEMPSNRPSFTKLAKSLDKMLALRSDYMDFDDNDSHQDMPCGNSAQGRTNDHPGKGHGQLGHSDSSEFSGEPDELQLWLHLKGPLPESDKTVDFVPMGQGEDSVKSNTPSNRNVDVEKNVYKRDRDCDILTVP